MLLIIHNAMDTKKKMLLKGNQKPNVKLPSLRNSKDLPMDKSVNVHVYVLKLARIKGVTCTNSFLKSSNY